MTNNENTGLKPCPLCGCSPKLKGGGVSQEPYSICCPNLHSLVGTSDRQGTIDEWNTRAIDTELDNYKFNTDDYVTMETKVPPLLDEITKLRELVRMKNKALEASSFFVSTMICWPDNAKCLELTEWVELLSKALKLSIDDLPDDKPGENPREAMDSFYKERREETARITRGEQIGRELDD